MNRDALAISEAKALLRYNGYSVIPKDRVHRVTYNASWSRQELEMRKFSEGFEAANRERMARGIGRELLKSPCVLWEQYDVDLSGGPTTVFTAEVRFIEPKPA